ncbi:hypothetical protein LX36DRAFT_666804 [Colletotrichum falcatum]|nr:hypothetical protein LX36DRAFT_666804 [Colletotrichum falcatum]
MAGRMMLQMCTTEKGWLALWQLVLGSRIDLGSNVMADDAGYSGSYQGSEAGDPITSQGTTKKSNWSKKQKANMTPLPRCMVSLSDVEGADHDARAERANKHSSGKHSMTREVAEDEGRGNEERVGYPYMGRATLRGFRGRRRLTGGASVAIVTVEKPLRDRSAET